MLKSALRRIASWIFKLPNIYDVHQKKPAWNLAYESVYFHHIGKTGGTTIDEKLRNWFGAYSFPDRGVTSRLLLKEFNYRYFSGHMPWEVAAMLPQPCLVLTTVGNPVDHFLSNFKHLARLGLGHILLHHRKRPLESIEDYLNDETIRPFTLNPQSYSIGREMNWFDFTRKCRATDAVNWSNAQDCKSTDFYFLYGTKHDDRSSAALFERAKRRTQRPNTIAITTESIDLCMDELFAVVTGSSATFVPERKNATPFEQQVQLTDSQRAEIESRTALDKQLFKAVQQANDERQEMSVNAFVSMKPENGFALVAW